MIVEIPFAGVGCGEVFTSNKTKRFVRGLKIKPISLNTEQGFLSLNVAIMGNAPDAGTLLFFADSQMVEVDRIQYLDTKSIK